MKIEHHSPILSEYKKLIDLIGWLEPDDNFTETALKSRLFSAVAAEQSMVIGFGLS